ncbi:tRNA (adenosine(37)-N6)-threonylcarbamoyltransferase complex ATPase subunit type 1 TsaE [candidate division KSB1 bacterium]|nr:tRNA (adenosine(37)-N6)-threonylcarbamoyltransferase complex ATPase subunit type 1 TsaE [candidate division KSB1 bacterium]
MQFITHSAAETRQLGAALSQFLRPGDVIALIGDLGSGKTCLTQGICTGLGVTEAVTSPTFVLINEYPGQYPVYHFDFYRLNSPAEIWALGVDDYFNGAGICIIEWADRGLSLLPSNRIEIYLESWFMHGRENERHIALEKASFLTQLSDSSWVKGLIA